MRAPRKERARHAVPLHEHQIYRRCLTAYAHGAEAEDYVTAICGAAKAEHRAETGKHQDLVELVARFRRRRTGKNLVTLKLAFGVDADIDEQTMRGWRRRRRLRGPKLPDSPPA